MKVAIPFWQGRVSPVLDVAGRILLVDIEGDREQNRQEISLPAQGPMQRARSLARLGVDVLICGAVSRGLEMALAAAGVRVIPYTCGEVAEVLSAYRDGRLEQGSFRMPGSSAGPGGAGRRR
jgi:predicted Fe-Mo cluster-binding NifX family protein